MRPRHRPGSIVFAAGLALCLAGQHASAEQSETGPASDERDRLVAELIERNQRLRELYEVNPEVTRAIALRLMEAAAQDDAGQTGATDDDGDGGIADPDFDALGRSSPQAVLDLIELMKLASETRDPNQGIDLEGQNALGTGGVDGGGRAVRGKGGGEPD